MLEKFVDAATNRMLDTAQLGKDAQPEAARITVELLNNPEQRNDEIWDWFILGWLNAASADMDQVEASKVALDLATLVDQTFDQLNETPTVERSQLWEVASQIMVAAAARQARIMTGVTKQSMVDGIEDAGDLKEDLNGVSKSDLEGAHLNIASEMKRKEAEKKNGGS